MPTDAELLIELASLDEIEAYVPTSTEHDMGAVPPWCELVVKMKRTTTDFPLSTTLPLRRHDGELLIEVVRDVLHPDRSSSASEYLWEELDTIVDSIQRRVERDRPPRQSDVGHALGLATALAAIANPADPDVDAVRSEAMERWESRHS